MKTPRLYFALLFIGIVLKSNATHIVGGEINYRNLGNYKYEIKFTMYRDCHFGQTLFDNPASIGVFDVNNILVTSMSIDLHKIDTVPLTINTSCFTPPKDICYEVTTYTDTIYLPPIAGGYQIVYQRCCRNQNIANIKAETGGTGATYYASIPDTSIARVNSNPVFTNDHLQSGQVVPVYICSGEPLSFDYSAIDFDSDSLVYELLTPLAGPRPDSAMPQPPNKPPYQNVVWKVPYSLANVLGNSTLNLDPHTGLLTANPSILGQFAYGIGVKEFRNGKLIGETKRDFEINVIKCPDVIVSSINQKNKINCANVIHFQNESSGATCFVWDFGIKNLTNDTSTKKTPTYIFPDTGYYHVMLIASSIGVDPACNDTSYENIYIQPPYKTDFTLSNVNCFHDISFRDSSSIVNGVLNSLNWDFGDGIVSTGKSPMHRFITEGKYNVTLISDAGETCTDTAIHSFEITPLLSSNISINNCQRSISVNAVYGKAPYSFLWSNAETNTTISNLSTGQYTVKITDTNGCEARDSIFVNESDFRINVPNTFTPNGDGINDTWMIKNIDKYPSNDLVLFNRWGDEIYRKNNFNNSWDGQGLNPGSYYYILTVKTCIEQGETFSGFLNIIR